jgi:predicted phage baseplate assembly protein
MATFADLDLACADERRRRQVREQGLNGIDTIEVSDDHRVLRVSFLGRAPAIGTANVRIDGGSRVTGIVAVDVRQRGDDDPDLDHEVDITVDRPGDFSTYRLCLVEAADHGYPADPVLDDFDPRSRCLDFSFMAGCPSDLDCAPVDDCPPPAFVEPEISYLAKDYASFRQLILDRLALVMPGWTERHIPDVGITLIELLAYVGDYLSYFQDAVATEAYLDTARKRISVRRHVRLVDYPMHDGCNARAWVRVEVSRPVTLDPARFAFITDPGRPGTSTPAGLTGAELASVTEAAYTVFEPISPGGVRLVPAHNEIHFWTWGDRECCLDRGATRATLRDEWVEPAKDGGHPSARARALDLRPGDVLVFEEVRGPRSGERPDADPTHRQAVRLTDVTPGVDELFDQPVLGVAWTVEDALTVPLCLSAVAGPACELVEPTVARGNVVLADHGHTNTRCGAPPEPVPAPPTRSAPAGCAGPGDPRAPVVVELPVDRRLARAPVTASAAFPPPGLVSAGQSARLAGIPGRVRQRLRGLWRQAHDGKPLSADQVEEIRVVYGDRALARARFPLQRPRSRRPAPAAEQAAALRRLLDTPRLLAKKTRWLDDLARRARAGLRLGPDQLDEIRQTWGDAYTDGLAANSLSFAGPARDALRQDPHDALAVIRLRTQHGDVWNLRRDLLGSGPDDPDFVAEADDDGVVHLRFGDGDAGRAPAPGTAFVAEYRIGNGTAGNVGAGAISHLVVCTGGADFVTTVVNPFPAQGGTDPQSVAEVKLVAPGAFRRGLRRAVTADDYAVLAGQLPGLQGAAANLRWTGSGYEVELAVDPLGTEEVADALLERVREGVFRYRRIGHDLAVERARYVPLLLGLRLCALPHHLRGAVESALLDVFGSRALPDGRRGFFHPDNLTFGADVEVSRIVALAQAVPGVESVEVLRLERFGEGDRGERLRGFLRLGPLEIPRLDNDPAQPEHGQLQIEIGGGR